MGFFDKLKDTANQAKDAATKFAEDKGISEKFENAKTLFKESVEESKAKAQAHKEAANEAKKPLDGCIQWYEVMFQGGLKEIDPKKKGSASGTIGMNIMPDSFYFKPLLSAKEWFPDLEIPYDKVKKFELVKRTVSNTEMFLSNGANDAAALATLNTMAITYDDQNGEEIYLKMEMLTGYKLTERIIWRNQCGLQSNNR